MSGEQDFKTILKEKMTTEDVFDLLTFFGGEPIIRNGRIFSHTICHHSPFCGKHKLVYDPNKKSFTCFTDCGETFDIYTLIIKVKTINEEFIECSTREGQKYLREWNLKDAVNFLGGFLDITESNCEFNLFNAYLDDSWKVIDKYKKLNKESQEKKIIKFLELEEKPDEIKNYPFAIFTNWEEEGITKETLKNFNIKYDPVGCNILIPHYDINNRLIGIRSRALVKEVEQTFGKYVPAMISETNFAHPLSFNLYGLNKTKDNIKRFKKAIIFEGEKSVLMLDSFLGSDNNISVAVCGSLLKAYQVKLLLSLGVEEIIIGFDRQYQIPDYKNYSNWIKTEDGKEYLKWIKKLKKIKKEYGNVVRVTFLLDKTGDYLEYKDSPTDKGEKIFKEFYKRRSELR